MAAVKNVHGVFAIDPGGTTGVAAAHVDLDLPTLKEVLKSRKRAKAAEVGGDWLLQAQDIATKLGLWVMDCERFGIPVQNRHLVFEDFILRRREAGGATGNLTSIWVMAATVALSASIVDADQIAYQQASQAKGFARDDRLKLWDMWEVGSDHKRDAWRHFALRTNQLLG